MLASVGSVHIRPSEIENISDFRLDSVFLFINVDQNSIYSVQYTVYKSMFYICGCFYFFYAPEGTLGGILKSHRPSVRLLQIVSQR